MYKLKLLKTKDKHVLSIKISQLSYRIKTFYVLQYYSKLQHLYTQNCALGRSCWAIFKTRNEESGNGMGNRGMERGTRKAGIFKTRNEKSRNL